MAKQKSIVAVIYSASSNQATTMMESAHLYSLKIIPSVSQTNDKDEFNIDRDHVFAIKPHCNFKKYTIK